MSVTILSPAAPQTLPHLCSHAPFRALSSPSSPLMNLLKLKPHRGQTFFSHLLRHRRRLSVSAAAVRQDTTPFTSAPLVTVSPAAESLFHVVVDVADSPDVAASYTKAGQYLQLRVPDSDKPSFLAIASPPSVAATKGVFEFLVKTVPGSAAELLCELQKGDVVELSHAMGKGFQIDQISPPENYQTLLIFATGSGIR